MLDRLKGELKRDIAKAAQPLSRVRNALYVRAMIPLLENRKMEELDVQARGVATLLQRLEDRKARLMQARDAQARKLERLRQDPLPDMKEPALKRALENCYRLRMPEGPWSSGDEAAKFAKESVKNINGLVYSFQHALLRTWRETRPAHDPEGGGEGEGANEGEETDERMPDADALVVFWNGLRPEISDQDARACIRDAFGSLEARLGAYWFDGYFSKDNYIRDCRYLVAAGERARQRLEEISRAAYLEAAKVRLEAHRKKNRDARRKASLSISRYEDALQACETRSRSLRGSQGGLARARQQYRQRMQESLKTSDRFVRLLDDRYAATLKQRRGLIVRKKPGMRSLFALLSIPALMQTHDYLRIMTGSHEQEQ
jgi:hypothetical protein